MSYSVQQWLLLFACVCVMKVEMCWFEDILLMLDVNVKIDEV